MAKDQDKQQPAQQQAPAAAQQPAAASPPVQPPAPAPMTLEQKVATIVSVIREIGGQLSLPQRTAIIEAMNSHMQPAPSPPSPYDGRREFTFRVSRGETIAEIVAHDPREAWALFCDNVLKSSPSPKSGKVECLGESAAAA